MAKIAAGTLLTLDFGPYYELDSIGPVEVMKDFDQLDVVNTYLAHETAANLRGPNLYDFAAWLKANGFVRDAENSFGWSLGKEEFEPEIWE